MNKPLSHPTQSNVLTPTITIDPTYNLLRIHKSTLTLLNHPKHIQLLINPQERTLALCDTDSNNPLGLKINYEKINEGKCCEMYSTPFIERLLTIYTQMPTERFRLKGNYIKAQNIVLFHLEEYTHYEKE